MVPNVLRDGVAWGWVDSQGGMGMGMRGGVKITFGGGRGRTHTLSQTVRSARWGSGGDAGCGMRDGVMIALGGGVGAGGRGGLKQTNTSPQSPRQQHPFCKILPRPERQMVQHPLPSSDPSSDSSLPLPSQSEPWAGGATSLLSVGGTSAARRGMGQNQQEERERWRG